MARKGLYDECEGVGMPPKGERRKQQIVNTAKQMFIDKGFQSTHIGQVCDKLDIARGTVYQYFRNKKEILYAILEDVQEKMEDIFDQDDLSEFFNSNPTPESVLDFISKRITQCISVILNEPIVIKLIFKEIVGVDEEVNVRVQKAIAAIQMIIGGVMLVVYECDLSKRNVLDANIIKSIAKNYLHGVLKQ
jgi:AcrR family transcriptional regulator